MVSKTGGGRGTNQYAVKGRSIAQDGSVGGSATQAAATYDLTVDNTPPGTEWVADETSANHPQTTRVVYSADAMSRLADRIESVKDLGEVSLSLRETLPDRVRMAVRARGIEFHIDDLGGRLNIWEATSCPNGYRPPVELGDDDDIVEGLHRAHERAAAFDAVQAADAAVHAKYGPHAHRCDGPEISRFWANTLEFYKSEAALKDARAGW